MVRPQPALVDLSCGCAPGLVGLRALGVRLSGHVR